MRNIICRYMVLRWELTWPHHTRTFLWGNWNRSSCIPRRRCLSYDGDISMIFLPCGLTANLLCNYSWMSLIVFMIQLSLRLIGRRRKTRGSIWGMALWKRIFKSNQPTLTNIYKRIVAIPGTAKLPFPMYKLFTYVEFARNRITSVNDVMNLMHICLTEVMKRTCYRQKYNRRWVSLGKCVWR